MNIGIKISELRNKAGMTQEALADALDVSRQAVQKWESNASCPDINNLLAISQRFNVPLDELLQNKISGGTVDDARFGSRNSPSYDKLMHWEVYSANLQIECRQMREEGLDVEQYKKLVDEVSALPVCQAKEDLATLVGKIMASAPMRKNYEFTEPSTLDEIKKLRQPSGIVFTPPPANSASLRDSIRGAWQGRIAGCLIGKPFESVMTNDIRHVLKATGNFPMSRYVFADEVTDEIRNGCENQLKRVFYGRADDCAPSDDDTNYTVMSALKIIEAHGKDFQPIDVAKCWMANQPKDAYCTAERVAFINFVNGYFPPVSAVRKNPFREWIGAQIRGDYFGYICPGDPEFAAEMAWRDASISHTKNGIYGEMFVAAMLACAAVCKDTRSVVLGGLAEIPATSRLYAQVMEIVAMYDAGKNENECFELFRSRYDEHDWHDWCHTISNALIVVISLLYCKLDFGKSVCDAVQAGFDTDCNGATVGSIVGMMIGAANIPDCWTAPFNNKVDTSIFGVGIVSVEALCDITMKHISMKRS